MSQIVPRVAALAAAPLPAAVIAATPDSSDAAVVAATPTATDVPRDAAKSTTATASEATAANANASTTAADNFATTAGTGAPDAAAVTTTTPAIATPATTTSAIAANKHATTAQVGTPAPMPQSPANAGSLGGAVFALVLVVGLILALAWLAKRLPGVAGTSNPALRIVGSLSLGPRERVVVVAVGDTQLLLGVGAGGTRTLHTLTEPLPVAASTTPAFAQLLAQHFGKKA